MDGYLVGRQESTTWSVRRFVTSGASGCPSHEPSTPETFVGIVCPWSTWARIGLVCTTGRVGDLPGLVALSGIESAKEPAASVEARTTVLLVDPMRCFVVGGASGALVG